MRLAANKRLRYNRKDYAKDEEFETLPGDRQAEGLVKVRLARKVQAPVAPPKTQRAPMRSREMKAETAEKQAEPKLPMDTQSAAAVVEDHDVAARYRRTDMRAED